jgi:hypothetical protein
MIGSGTLDLFRPIQSKHRACVKEAGIAVLGWCDFIGGENEAGSLQNAGCIICQRCG